MKPVARIQGTLSPASTKRIDFISRSRAGMKVTERSVARVLEAATRMELIDTNCLPFWIPASRPWAVTNGEPRVPGKGPSTLFDRKMRAETEEAVMAVCGTGVPAVNEEISISLQQKA